METWYLIFHLLNFRDRVGSNIKANAAESIGSICEGKLLSDMRILPCKLNMVVPKYQSLHFAAVFIMFSSSQDVPLGCARNTLLSFKTQSYTARRMGAI